MHFSMAQVEMTALKATYAAQDADSFTDTRAQVSSCKCLTNPAQSEPKGVYV